MNKPQLGDRRKRDGGIRERQSWIMDTLRGMIADHLRMHFASVSRILRARDKMLIK
jgi:hypothetical protein